MMALKKVLLIIISCSVGDAVGKYKKVLPLHPLNCTVFPFFLASMYCFMVLYFETTLVMALLFDELKEYTYTYI